MIIGMFQPTEPTNSSLLQESPGDCVVVSHARSISNIPEKSSPANEDQYLKELQVMIHGMDASTSNFTTVFG